MKRLWILALALAFASALALVGCGGGSGDAAASPDEGASTPPAEAATEAANNTATEAAETTAVATDAMVSAADLANVTETVAFGDFDTMQALSKAIQNGEKTGTVVQIDGVVSNFSKGMSYSISENKADGSGNVGTVFVIDDAPDESAYPSDGTHVLLTGIVVGDGASFNIHTLMEFVKVLE